MKLEELFDVISDAIVDVVKGSDGMPKAIQKQNCLMASHFVFEMAKRLATPRMSIDRCVDLAQRAMLKNIRIESPDQLRKALGEKNVFNQVVEERVDVVETQKATDVESSRESISENYDRATETGGRSACREPEKSGNVYAYTDRTKRSSSARSAVANRGIPERSRRDKGKKPRTSVEAAPREVKLSILPVEEGEGKPLPQSGGGRQDDKGELGRRTNPGYQNSHPSEPKGGRTEQSVLGGDNKEKRGEKVTPEELQQAADEIARKRVDVMKNVEEIDNPNKATRNIGVPGQNDNVQLVSCKNCGFDVASYEIKCVACGCRVKV